MSLDRTTRPAETNGHYWALVNELVEVGMACARDGQLQAAQTPTGQAAAVLAAADRFERASRAVRRGVLLARSLDCPQAQPSDPAERLALRRRLLQEIERAIQRGQGRTRNRQAGMGRRPAAEVVADICRDLGLAAASGTATGKRRVQADIAALCARAAGLPPEPPAPVIRLPVRPRTGPAPRPGAPGAILLEYSARSRRGPP